jgi:hypothetical protein
VAASDTTISLSALPEKHRQLLLDFRALNPEQQLDLLLDFLPWLAAKRNRDSFEAFQLVRPKFTEQAQEA